MKTHLYAIAILASLVTGVALAEGPVNYPEEAPMVSTKTRGQVHAETLEAHRLGLIVYGEKDVPIATMVSTKTRAQVHAETLEARRLGLIVYGEKDVPIATPEQERQIADAGLRALKYEVAAK